MKHLTGLALAAVFVTILTGCASTKLTVDDGRKLDEKLLSEMKAFGTGAEALRPAIVKSAALDDKDCSNQYELPFDVLTSYGVKSEDERVAWVRILGVNENISIIAADASANLNVGDVVTEVDGYESSNKLKMVQELAGLRDNGKPFKLKLASGKEVLVTPLKVCRGYTFMARPAAADTQNYHWTVSVHPLEVFQQPLTLDEALWVVLWTQGLSEEGGVRMKTYSFVVGGIKFVGYAALTVATAGATVAAGGAAAAGGASAGAIVGQMVAVQVAGKTVTAVAAAAANKASLSGLNSVAAGVFDKADKWAFENMKKLGANPRAGLQLHELMAQQNAVKNAFLLDEERLAQMNALIAELPDEPKTVEVSVGETVRFELPEMRTDSVEGTPSSISGVDSEAPPAGTNLGQASDGQDMANR